MFVDDVEVLATLNERFVDAFRKGSWQLLEPILAPGFSYLDGATGRRLRPKLRSTRAVQSLCRHVRTTRGRVALRPCLRLAALPYFTFGRKWRVIRKCRA